MARALKLKLDELVFTFDLDMEEYGPEVVDVSGTHLLQDGKRARSPVSNRIEFLCTPPGGFVIRLIADS